MTTLKKCLATTMLMAGFISGGIHAADVTINITGQVIAAACTTDVGSTYNIDLGQEISAATLNSAGAASTYVSQDIVLSDCPAGTTSVTATFDGTKDSGNDTMYANATGEGYATNVAVELQNKTAGTDVGKGATMTVDVDASQKATFPLQARAFSKSGGTTPGNISTTVLMNFTYN